jgi:hypothetical protein
MLCRRRMLFAAIVGGMTVGARKVASANRLGNLQGNMKGDHGHHLDAVCRSGSHTHSGGSIEARPNARDGRSEA